MMKSAPKSPTKAQLRKRKTELEAAYEALHTEAKIVAKELDRTLEQLNGKT